MILPRIKTVACAAATVLILSVVLIRPAAGQSGPTRFAEWMVQDARDWGTSWSWERGKKVGTVAVLLVPISLLDEDMSEQRRKSDSRIGDFLEVANFLGGPEAKFIAAGAFGASLLTPSTKLQDATFTSLQSMVYAYAITSLSKRALVGRNRPYEEEGAFTFSLLSNTNSSFPSGHATTAWALVMPYMVYYPGPITFVMGVLATGTAITRLQRQQHWVTDVMAGSFLGGSMGYWLARKHQGKLDRFALDIGPAGASLTIGL